jgi:hypothetical protein
VINISWKRWARTTSRINDRSGFGGGANGSVCDHHLDFLASAAQMHRIGERQSWLVIAWIRIGGGEAIIE